MQPLNVRFEGRKRELEVHGPGGVDDVRGCGLDLGVHDFVEAEGRAAEIAGQSGGFRGVEVEMAVHEGVAQTFEGV